jgi:ligand-binding sensor domain-containing protein
MRSELSAALALLLSGTVPTATSGLDPGREATQYRHASWSFEDGLPHGNVNCLLQSRDRYLWLGTTAGLVRFDGIELSDPPSPLAEVVADRSIAALLEAPDGTLWVGTDEGVVSYRDGVAGSFGTGAGLSHPKVTALALDADGRLWVGTLGGLDRLEGDSFLSFSTADGLPHDYIFSLAVDRESGLLWVGTYEGLAVQRGQAFESIDLGDDNRSGIGAVLSVSGGLWIGTTEGSLMRRRTDGSLEHWSAPEGIQALLIDGSGQLWLGTLRGLWRFRDGTFQAPLEVSDIVLGLVEDREGNLWVGTRPGVLHRLSDASFVAWSTNEGLPDGATTAILEDRRGDVWIGTRQGLGQLHAGRVVRTLTTSDGLKDDEVLALAETDKGVIWVATRTGLHRLRDGILTGMPSDSLPIRGPYWELLAGPGDELWLGAFGGVVRLGRNVETLISSSHPHDSGSALARDPMGAVWIGTLGGGVWSPDAPSAAALDFAHGHRPLVVVDPRRRPVGGHGERSGSPQGRADLRFRRGAGSPRRRDQRTARRR